MEETSLSEKMTKAGNFTNDVLVASEKDVRETVSRLMEETKEGWEHYEIFVDKFKGQIHFNKMEVAEVIEKAMTILRKKAKDEIFGDKFT